MYDLIVSGQAWHWVNPVLGVAKAASLLVPGGHLGVFWNRGQPGEEARRALEAVYERLAPELTHTTVALNLTEEPADRYEEFKRGGVFSNVEARAYPWDTVYDRAGWINLVSTHSDHLRLPDARRRELVEALGDTVDALGGAMTYHYSTLLVLATRRV
jgi:SAM-dependent methyltransferase